MKTKEIKRVDFGVHRNKNTVDYFNNDLEIEHKLNEIIDRVNELPQPEGKEDISKMETTEQFTKEELLFIREYLVLIGGKKQEENISLYNSIWSKIDKMLEEE